MASYRLEHIGLVCPPTQRDATMKFYESVFGWRIVREKPGVAFIADGNGGRIEFHFTEGAPIAAQSHLAFVVPAAEFDDVMAKIKATGARSEAPFVTPQGDRLFFFDDPAGNRAQIVAREDPMPE